MYTKTKASTSLVVEALKLFKRGLVPIPVHGKASLVKWKHYYRTRRRPTREEIVSWFERKRINGKTITGIAVLLGSISADVRVRDFDTVESYRAWAKQFPHLAMSLPRAKTRRGFHVFFACNGADETCDVVGTPPHRVNDKESKDGEYRGGRGYVVCPPSAHPLGGKYKWTTPPDPKGWPRLTGKDLDGLRPFPVNPFTVADTCNVFAESLPAQASVLHAPGKNSYTALPEPVQAAIQQTLPTGPGQRHRCIWRLVGRLKALPITWTPAARMAAIREWHRQALPYIRTKAIGETITDFLTAWKNRSYAAGGAWKAKIKKAMSGSVPAIADDLNIQDHQWRQMMRLMANLQAQVGDAPFSLSCRQAADAIGVGKTLANKILKYLEGLGVLQVVTPGKPGKPGDPATVWRWLGP